MQTPSHSRWTSLWEASALGDLPAGDHTLLSAHAADCPQCARLASLESRLDRALAPSLPALARRFVSAGPRTAEVVCTPAGVASVRLGVAPTASISPSAEGTAAATLADRAAGELEEYFRGRRRSFSVQPDLSGLAPFQRSVLEATAAVPPGAVVTYGEIARRIGRPRAVRAVGTALARNPVPLIVPCHRVLPAGGRLGNYSGGGPEVKRWLLELEGVLQAAS